MPIDTRIDIITKAVFKEYVEMPFGAYKAQVAIGGVKKLTDKERLHQAVYCFATLYYSEEGQMTTIDFHSQVR